MAFIVVHGTKPFTKTLTQVGPYTCPNCEQALPFDFVRESKWFTLYWIPLFPFSIKHYHVCPNCKASTEVPKEEAKRIAAFAKEAAKTPRIG